MALERPYPGHHLICRCSGRLGARAYENSIFINQKLLTLMKRMIIWLCLLSSGLLHAQDKPFRGTVRDQQMKPIGGAVVSVIRTGERSVTNTNGVFNLVKVSMADSITITSSGYAAG